MIFFIQVPLLTKDNFNETFDRFYHLILQECSFKKGFSEAEKTTQKTLAKSWNLKAIKDKRKMYKTLFLNGNSAQKELYKHFSTKLTKIKTGAKQKLFRKWTAKS